MNNPFVTSTSIIMVSRLTATASQRFGHITGPGHGNGDCHVRDDETGVTFSLSYADIVTEGFRSLRLGERVRFLLDPARPDRASYVIRIDTPDVEDYYQEADSNNVEDLPARRIQP